MHLVEEPLVTRRQILRSLKLGAPTTGAPFTTMRSRGMASRGWSMYIRSAGGGGRVAGRVHVYSVLNVDAARAVRQRQPDLACRLAARADALEASAAADVLRGAVEHASVRLSAYFAGAACDDAWSDRLTRYLQARQGASWEGLDREALAREWLVRSEAWLHAWPDHEEEVRGAVRELAAATRTAREQEVGDQPLQIDSFTGVVRHLDPDCAEIVSSNDEAWIVSRRELDREGLARLGEAVTVVREELPAGGEAWLVAPAVDMREPSTPLPRGAGDLSPFVGPVTWLLDDKDEPWLARALRRDPFVLPRTPVRIAPAR